MNDLPPFHRETAHNKDEFPDGPSMEWVNANRASLDHWVMQAVGRVLSQLSNVGYDMAIDSVSDTGIHLKLSYEDYCRQCHMGTIRASISFTFAELLDPDFYVGTEVKNRFEADREAQRAAKVAKEAADKAKERERTRPAREAAERAKLAELKAKYEASGEPGLHEGQS